MAATCLFRVDAAPFMGVGHLARCIALAQALRARGARVVFICRDFPGGAHNQVAQQGFELHLLPGLALPAHQADTTQWLCCGQAADAATTQEILKRESLAPDWIVVDHYGIHAEWEQLMRADRRRIFVIDDLADRRHDCDLLLDQSLRDDNPYAKISSHKCIFLLGPRYALLREEFATLRPACKVRQGKIGKILVFFGGSDHAGDTLKVIHALLLLGRSISTDIIVGVLNKHREAIERLCIAHPEFSFVFQTSDMAARLARADLAIGGGGTSSWERLATGTPAVLIEQADNQAQNVEQLARLGVARVLGKSRDVTTDQIASALAGLLAAPELLNEMSGRAFSLVDAIGSRRVADALVRPVVDMRRAAAEDCDRVYQWRNSPAIRRFSLQSGEIDIEHHRRWFRESLQDPDRDLLMGMAYSEPIGVVRFDTTGVRVVVSIYLAPAFLGQGWGAWLLQSAERWLVHARETVEFIDARVLDENVASKRMFESLGYLRNQDIFTKRLCHE